MGIKYPNATHYSKHYSRKELDCKCGCITPPVIQKHLRITAINAEAHSRKLGRILVRRGLQAKKGRAITKVLSGFRCPAHNKAVHGAINSQHLTGKAIDWDVPAGQQNHYVLAASRVRAFRRGGIGVYPSGGVHADWRGWKARWTSFKGQ